MIFRHLLLSSRNDYLDVCDSQNRFTALQKADEQLEFRQSHNILDFKLKEFLFKRQMHRDT